MYLAKMNEKEKEQWNELYEYVKNEILQYEKTKSLSKNIVLRLKGLKDGKFMANKNVKTLGEYDYSTILMTFKLCKLDILMGLKSKEFNNENHKINYVMFIIENKINDTVDIINRKKLAEEKSKNIYIDTDIEKATYKRKTKDLKNKKLDNLW